jgi:uncharacterized protein (DUF1697 family)
MPTFVSLLRSVNVAGRTLRMAELRALYERLGHHDVVTYVQSGNVVSRTSTRSADVVAERIRTAVRGELGLDVAVLVRTPAELHRILDHNPFLASGAHRPQTLHVTFLAERPSAARTRSVDGHAFEPDEFRIEGREVYVVCPNGYGRTRINNAWFERHLQVTATTRNWATVGELVELADV